MTPIEPETKHLPRPDTGADRWTRGRLALSVLTIGFLLVPGRAYASLDPNQPLASFLHQSWGTAQGLPQNSVMSVAQTQDGYLWAGTEEGLARFDGATFTVFNLRNSGLPNDTVTSLAAAGGNALWIGTYGGLARMEAGHFTVYTEKNGLPSNSILCVHQDRLGVLWAGTDGGGLVRFEKGHFRVYSKADGLIDNTVFSLSEDPEGRLWIGLRNGFNVLDHERVFAPKQNEYLKQKNVTAIAAAKDGSVWLGTPDGVYVLSHGEMRHYTTADGLTGNRVNSILEDRAGGIWLGSNPSALNRFANGRFDSLPTSSTSVGSTLWAIFEDIEGNIWFGETATGLHTLKAGAIRTMGPKDGLASETILGTFQERDGSLWIGSDRGLTNLRNGHAIIYGVREGMPDALVFSVAQDHNGTIWAGTRRGVVSIQDGRVKTWNSEPALAGHMVDCIFADQAGNIWFGSRGGLTRFDGTSFTTLTTKDGLANNFVLSIDQGDDGTLWVGTQGGLTRWKDGKAQVWTTRDGLANDVVHAVYADRKDTVWLGTSGGGLTRLQEGKFTTVTSRNGLFDDNVFAILDDHAGHLWFSSNRGIFSISKQQFNAVAEGRLQRLTPAVYGVADGMKSPECNGGFQPAGWRLEDGRIAFPTMSGLALLTPPKEGAAGHELSAILEQVLVDGKERALGSTIDVPPGRGQLEFHFTAPTFTHANSIQFRYILEGFDRDWTIAGNRRSAYYTNIPHGQYRFRVRAGYGDDWRDGGSAVNLKLEPHVYETVPFFVLIAMALVGSCAAAYSWRVDRLKDRENELLRLVNERTSALQESERQVRRSRDELEIRVQERTIELVRSNHALEAEILVRRQTESQLTVAKEHAEQASKAKSDFLANISHEIRTPINGIVGMTEITLSTDLQPEQREYLDIVKLSADSLLEVVTAVLDFSNIESRQFHLDWTHFPLREALEEVVNRAAGKAAQKSLKFSSFVDPDVPDLMLGDPVRIKQVVANLLDNAIKFTKSGYVRLDVQLENNPEGSSLLHFSVADSGIGVPIEKQRSIFEPFNQADNSSTRLYGGTGLGLTIAAQIVSIMQGKLWVESDGQHGSVFHFTTSLHQPGEPTFERPVRAAIPETTTVG